MNVTLLSLSISSSFSNSPFYTIQKCYENRKTISIINSCFSRSYSNFIFSNSVIYQTLIKNNAFSFFLKTPLFFTEEDETEKPTVYKNQNFTSRLQYQGNNKIIIAGGNFKECKTTNNGAGLLISQNCEVLVHGVVFHKCETVANGGGMYISAGINEPTETSFNTNFNDYKLSKAEIQYCCFSHCLTWKNDNNIKVGFGAGAMIAGENVNIFFVSTNNHFESGEQKLMSRGARIDIQATNIFAHYINGTKSYSVTCAAFEFRGCSSGSIKYQTFQSNDSGFVECFTNMNNVEISECNMARNVMRKYESVSIDPGLVYARDSTVTIGYYVITGTQINDNGQLARKYENSASITLSNWKVWGFGDNLQRNDYTIDNCIVMNSAEETIPFSHLNLSECGGDVPVAQLIITSMFTPSFDFTFTNDFSESLKFSESKDFSNSKVFSKTKQFTNTDGFSKTEFFTKSLNFSNSEYFTKSKVFSYSEYFNKTNSFSNSDHFSKSNGFSETKKFTKSIVFSESSDFSKSAIFLDSKYFSSSFYFSQSKYFSETVEFTKTSQFSFTDEFSFSTFFTLSYIFTASEYLNKTHSFSPSSKYTKSSYFSSSFYFSNSEYFTKTYGFNDTLIFTKSTEFSKSKIFNPSSYFEKTAYFSSSFYFADSEIFTKSETLIDKSDININIKSENDNKASIGMKVGIGVTCGVVAASLIATGAFFLIRSRRRTSISDLEEVIELTNDTGSSIFIQNPLINEITEDDPFLDDFL